MASLRSPLLSRATDKDIYISHPTTSDSLFTYRLLWMFQYDLVTTEYRGYNNQELQAGKVPANARSTIEPLCQTIFLVYTVTLLTEDRTNTD